MKKIKDKKLDKIKTITLNTAIAGLISISLYETAMSLGLDNFKLVNDESIETEEGIAVDIPNAYKQEIYDILGLPEDYMITDKDLSKLNSYLILTVRTDDDLSFLNYCDNLRSLYVVMLSDNVNVLSTIDSLSNLNKFSYNNMYAITSGVYSDSLTLDNCKFLTNSPSINYLELNNINVDMKLIESIDNLNKISIEKHGMDANYYNYDYSKFVNLDELVFNYSTDSVYDIATYFDSETYNLLIENGVDVKFSSEEDKTDFLVANSMLDTCMYELGLKEDESNQEKILDITCYVLDKLEYDQDFINNDSIDDEKYNSFYQKGLLYGALTSDTQICGNYAALFQALAKRAGVNTELLMSNNHAWNIVSVEGEYYVVDTTWLDQMKYSSSSVYITEDGLVSTVSMEQPMSDAIRSGHKDIDWYMHKTDFTNNIDIGESHVPINFPSYLVINPVSVSENEVDENNIEVLDNQVYEIEVKGRKKYYVGGGVLMSILIAFGGAMLIDTRTSKKKKHNEILSEVILELNEKEHNKKRKK